MSGIRDGDHSPPQEAFVRFAAGRLGLSEATVRRLLAVPRGATGWHWEILCRLETSPVGDTLEVAAHQALLQQTARLRELSRSSIPFWGPRAASLASRPGMGHRGGDGKGEGRDQALVLDRDWEPSRVRTALQVDGPVLTSTGQFRLDAVGTEPCCEGAVLVCNLLLAEGESLRFEEAFRWSSGQWRAEIRGEGLPAPEAELRIPGEYVALFICPRLPVDSP